MVTRLPVEVAEIFGELESSPDRKWLVIHTKPKREKKLADYSFQFGIHYYLPLMESPKIYQYRKVLFTKPMFSGYLFAHCNKHEQQELINTGHIVNFLHVHAEEELLEDLKQIRLGSQKEVIFQEHHYLEEGYQVVFREGALKGIKGIVTDITNVREVVLQIHMLKQAVSVKADINDLEIIPEKRSFR